MRALVALTFALGLVVFCVGCKSKPAAPPAKPVSCATNAKQLGATVGATYHVSCPGSCNIGSVWGTDSYTTDSKVCKAALHAGVIGAAGGVVKVSITQGLKAYVASKRNGIQTSRWGSYSASFTVSKP